MANRQTSFADPNILYGSQLESEFNELHTNIDGSNVADDANIGISKTDFLSSASTGNTLLGYAEATSNEAIVTSEADITSLSVTVTVPAGGRKIRISGNVRGIANDGPRNHAINIKESTTQLQTYIWTSSGVNAQNTFHPSHIFAASAGSHTYKLTCNPGGGTLTLQAAATAPNYILVELV